MGLYSRTVCCLGVLPLGTLVTETRGHDPLLVGQTSSSRPSNASCPAADSFPLQPPSSLHGLGNCHKSSLHRSRQPPFSVTWLALAGLPPPPELWCLISWHAVSLAPPAFPLPSQMEAALMSHGHQCSAVRPTVFPPPPQPPLLRTESATSCIQRIPSPSSPKAIPKLKYSHVVESALQPRDPGKLSPDLSYV